MQEPTEGSCCRGCWWCVVCWSGSGRGTLSTRRVYAVAEMVGVSERTVWRWLEQPRRLGRWRLRSGRGMGCLTWCGRCWARTGSTELRRRLVAAGGGAGSRCWPRCAPRSCTTNPTVRLVVCPRRCGSGLGRRRSRGRHLRPTAMPRTATSVPGPSDRPGLHRPGPHRRCLRGPGAAALGLQAPCLTTTPPCRSRATVRRCGPRPGRRRGPQHTALAAPHPPSGRIALRPGPGTTSETGLAHDLLAVLGKPSVLPGRLPGGRQSAWEAVTAWLTVLPVNRADRPARPPPHRPVNDAPPEDRGP